MLIPILVLLLIDLYAFQAFRTVFSEPSVLKTITLFSFWTISIALYIATLLAMRNGFDISAITSRVIFGALICLAVAKLTICLFLFSDDLIRLGKWASQLFYNPPIENTTDGSKISRLAFLSKAGLVAGGTMFGLFVYGMIRTAYNYKIRKVAVHLDQLPSTFKGLKVVQISDMHLGSFISTEPIEKAFKIINDLEPDVILFTGDLVNSKAKEAMPFKTILSSLKAKIGVFSSLGNHDYYGSEDDIRQIIQLQKECGWNLLLNEHKVIDIDNHKIAIVGVENWGRSRHFPKRGDLNKALENCEPVEAKLLLSHDPSHWDEIISKEHNDIDVTFSGHTHGFQFGIEIPKLHVKFSPAQFEYKQWAGIYKRKKQHLYVNRGLGFIGYHGRVGIPPEITLMEIKGKKA